jgi:exopolysaccharide biosynthesis polyprenyl glycosylphosphotransferase
VLTSEPLDAVLFAASPSEYEPLQPLLERIELHGTPVFLSPELPTPRRGSVRPVWIADEPALLSRLTPSDRLALFVKTLADRIAAAVMLILLLPLFICTAIAIRLDSKGPLFFQQIRVGRFGRLFPMYKFRSMVVDAEALKQALAAKNEMQGPAFKMARDPRITKVGRFIRKFSIDELPQLFNVLLGDMSLVGPRPALPKEVAQYADWQRRRLTVKPGLTCIWQVSGRNSIPFEQWMELDLRYIDTWSLRLDAELLLRTVPTVIKGTGV